MNNLTNLTTSPPLLNPNRGNCIVVKGKIGWVLVERKEKRIKSWASPCPLFALNLKLGFLPNWNVPLMKDGIKRMVNNLKIKI